MLLLAQQMDKRVVVTGLGPVCSVGIGRKKVVEGLEKVRTGLTLHKEQLGGDLWEEFYVHELSDFTFNDLGIDPSLAEEVLDQRNSKDDTDLKYLLASIKLAIDDSKLKYDLNNNDLGFILTHENPGSDRYAFQIINEFYNLLSNASSQKWSLKEVANYFYERYSKVVYDLQTFMYLYYVSRVFSFHGYSLFINNACASGLYAIEAASARIRAGLNPVVIVAAADNPVLPFKYLWFKGLGLYSSDGKTKPFDKKRSGFVLGDGGGALMLEDLDHALKRKAHIYAEYLGGGFSQDAWRVTVPDVEGGFYEKALTEALRKSKVTPKEVDYLNPHGVGTSLGDRYEGRVIANVFGKRGERPFISALKPFLGHMLGGSALTETVLTLLSIETGRIPATLNLEEVDDEIHINIVKKPVTAKVNVAVKMANGFAGYNAAVVFRKIDSL